MNLIEYADRDMLAIDLANVLAGELKQALLHHDTVSLAVPGGTTPGPVFDVLCAADLDWERVHVLPTDERWVDPGHDRSNARLIVQRLLTHRAAAARFLPLYAPAPRPEDVLPEIEAMLAPELPLSVLLLGMGADGHVASLFPDAPGLEAALTPDAPTLVVLRPAGQPEARISLTARVLDGALAKHLVILGADKRSALERALFLDPEEAPVVAILDQTTVHWAE
jgi:6-phosphogluconolactonase